LEAIMGDAILKEEDFEDFRFGFSKPTLGGLVDKIRKQRVYRKGKGRDTFIEIMQGLGYSRAKNQYGIEVWEKNGVQVEPGGVPPELRGRGFRSWDDALQAMREGKLQ
jgi:hypothetical protein